MLPQDTDSSCPGGQDKQGQQTFPSKSSTIRSILSLGQLRKQSEIVSYKRKKTFMQIIKVCLLLTMNLFLWGPTDSPMGCLFIGNQSRKPKMNR